MVAEQTNSPRRWKRVEALFHACVQATTAERVDLLHGARDSEPSVSAEVERLLSLHDPTDTFLEPPDTDERFPGGATCATDHLLGMRVGAFRLKEPIASGGMGTVWLGERADEQYEQRVAIKLMNVGVMTGERRRRFERERQLLARLEHAYITRLIDGGTAENGTPYLTMEFVDGCRIDDYCDHDRLSIPKRLELFQKFCEAVHFAHQHLIVHRDIKPSNMLVTSEGTPKLLDFGISKLLDSTRDSATETASARDDATVTLVRALTPRYASPEQIKGDPITTASDVYSLGVVLYELLTGHRPYELNFESSTRREQAVCENDPTLPSAVLERTDGYAGRSNSTDLVTPDAIGELRAEPLRQLKKRLRGDLDNILLKAMEKDPHRRYASVQQFSEDIGRHLSGLPVIARRGTVVYRVAKFVRRNKPVVLATFAIIVALSASIVGANISLQRAQAERDVAMKVNEVLGGLVGPDSSAQLSDDSSVLDKLGDVCDQLNSAFGVQPAVEAATRHSVARLYANMHHWYDAERHALRSLALHRALYGDDDPTVSDCLTLLGHVMANLGRRSALGVQRDALEMRTKLYGDDHTLVVENKIYLAEAFWKAQMPPDWHEAQTLYRSAIDQLRAQPDSDPHLLGDALYGLGDMYLRQRLTVAVAQPFINKALEAYRSRPTRKDRALGDCVLVAANLERYNGKYAREREILEDYVNKTPRLLTVDELLARAVWRLALIADGEGSQERALTLYTDALRRDCARRVSQRSRTSQRWKSLAEALSGDASYAILAEQAGNTLAAISAFDSTVNKWLTVHVADVADFLGRSGYETEAGRLLDATLAFQREHWPSQADWHAYTQNAIGARMVRNGELSAGRSLLVKSYRTLLVDYRVDSPYARRAVRRLIELYELLGQTNKANAYRAKLPEGDASRNDVGGV